ncbi:Hypothetical protein PHPALM_17545 [Phytophthora palmivora]|uniref:BED-type domain-containing protein n=1 Tax=Phytophthora palmivora TaxID=4796 RepID=A0A2P4XLY5_9STRA|nr:Hypothetical protein PHPALM_17545 [Phytophthora palmivora]
MKTLIFVVVKHQAAKDMILSLDFKVMVVQPLNPISSPSTQRGGEENTPFNTRLEYNRSTPSRTRSYHVEKTPRHTQGLQKKKTHRSSRNEHNQVTDTGSNQTAAVPHQVLFDMHKKRKPQHWKFIQLVCNDEYIHMNKQDLRSEHARCAFCKKCNTEIKFEKACTANVTRHMAKLHAKELKQASAEETAPKKEQIQTLVHQDVDPMPTRSSFGVRATADEQDRCDKLAAIWIAKSSRSFTIVNDKYFQKYSRKMKSVQCGVAGSAKSARSLDPTSHQCPDTD